MLTSLHPLTLLKALEMELPLSSCGSARCNDNSSANIPVATSRRALNAPATYQPKPSGNQPVDSDYSMVSFSTEAMKSTGTSSRGNVSRPKRKLESVDDEDSLSSASVKSSHDASEFHDASMIDFLKRSRPDDAAKLQTQVHVQGGVRNPLFVELPSQAIGPSLFGNTGRAFVPFPAAAPVNLFGPSSDHYNLDTNPQISELLRNCGLGAAVSSFPNMAAASFDRTSLASQFDRHHPDPYSYPSSMTRGMSSAGDHLYPFTGQRGALAPQAGVPDASLASALLPYLLASCNTAGLTPYANVLASHSSPMGSAGLSYTAGRRSMGGTYSAVAAHGDDAKISPARQARNEDATAAVGLVARSNDKKPSLSIQRSPPTLPPCSEVIHHYSHRLHVPLATDEDQNWLSEFLCFVRADLVEVFRASRDDVASRLNSKKVVYGQVGIRCRYCAHLPHTGRASRSSSFPSSVGRIYQSLTMMLREHFGNCKVIPPELRNKFLDLKSKTSQGATNSKQYWMHSAMKLGMTDSDDGIWITEKSQAAALIVAPFGTPTREDSAMAMPASRAESNSPVVLLVRSTDRDLVSEFLYTLMTQVQRVHMTESEQVGSRKNLPLGLPGLGCRHCCPSNRRGLCRFFPARRRTLPNKLTDLSNHIKRCSLCPIEIKNHLTILERKQEKRDDNKESEGERAFFDLVWTRLGH